LEQFLADVKAIYDRLGRCVIAVSEGVRDAPGAPIVALLTLDAVAGTTRTMEDEFIAPNGTDVTDAFRLRHYPVAKLRNR